MAKNIISITTISQLPAISKDKLASSSIFETGIKVSTADANENKYSSYKVTYNELSDLLSSNIDSVLYPKYNIANTAERLTNLESNDLDIGGVKNFTTSAMINNKEIATTEKVQMILNESMPGFISSKSKIVAYSLNWGNSQSNSYDPYLSETITINQTGNLVIYGWMADTGNVAAAQAWISLDGFIQNNWEILQLKPWSTSNISNKLQYVNFNVPVANGLNIRIRTGFPVNTTISGAQNINRSLVTGNNISIGFKCYVIYNEISI